MAILGLNDSAATEVFATRYEAKKNEILDKLAGGAYIGDLDPSETGFLRGEREAIDRFFPDSDTPAAVKDRKQPILDALKGHMHWIERDDVTVVIAADGTVGGMRYKPGSEGISVGFVTKDGTGIPTVETDRAINDKLDDIERKRTGGHAPSVLGISDDFGGPGNIPGGRKSRTIDI